MTKPTEKDKAHEAEKKKAAAKKKDEAQGIDVFHAETMCPDLTMVFNIGLKPLDEIKKDCLVVLDTNVLLVPYDIKKETLAEIEKTYAELIKQKRLIVPGQVVREFAKNRPRKLMELFQTLNKKISSIQQFHEGKYPLLETLENYQKGVEL